MGYIVLKLEIIYLSPCIDYGPLFLSDFVDYSNYLKFY